ncbi:MAG: hypothetical protein H0W71_09260, partial [Sphingomonas sp.]|nr:hypothetical protein [Sphingomonas sp.]
RELAGLHEGLAELAAEQEEERAQRRSAILPAARRAEFAAEDDRPHPAPPARRRGRSWVEEPAPATQEDYDEARERIRSRLLTARRLYLLTIAGDLAKQNAWDLLVGPADWDKAVRVQAQDDETPEGQIPWMRQPDMVLTAQSGLMPDIAGGEDKVTPIRQALIAMRPALAEHPDAPADTEEETAAIAAYREQLIADGWEEDSQGNLWSPDPPSTGE